MAPSLRFVIRLVLLLAIAVWVPLLRAQEAPSVDSFIRALQDDNPLVRKRAAIALGKLGDRAKRAVNSLRRASKDAEEEVRSAVDAALEKIEPSLPFEDLLYRLIDKSADASDRIEACKELAERYWQQSGTTRALEAELNDNVVKEEAAKALDAIDARLKKQPAAAVSPRGTRIAVVNLKYIIQNSEKWSAFQAHYAQEFKKFQDRVKPLEKQLENITAQLKDPTLNEDDKERLEKDSKNLQNQMQEIGEEAKRSLGKKDTNNLRVIYKDVGEAASAYALAHDLDMVVHFTPMVTIPFFNPATRELDWGDDDFTRKMSSNALTPLFVKRNEVDISEAVLALMNSRYKPDPARPSR
jgi:Skp family chaperone for outer membrane proteins